jgi:hypothetical protein
MMVAQQSLLWEPVEPVEPMALGAWELPIVHRTIPRVDCLPGLTPYGYGQMVAPSLLRVGDIIYVGMYGRGALKVGRVECVHETTGLPLVVWADDGTGNYLADTDTRELREYDGELDGLTYWLSTRVIETYPVSVWKLLSPRIYDEQWQWIRDRAARRALGRW